MKAKNFYNIKSVCHLTGLKPHLIRAWEGRYNAVIPNRTQSNRRVYCQEDVLRLKLLKSAVDAGHQISHIANMSTTELEQLAGAETQTLKTPPSQRLDVPSQQRLTQNYLEYCIQAVIELDMDLLEKSLSEASVQLTRRAFIEGVIVPMFVRIGKLWESGRLKIINEHMASNYVRTTLWDMLRTVEISRSAPRIIIGAPSGQWHELGALVAALISAEAGWRPYYVGVNLPAEELASAIDLFKARGIGLSISHALDDYRLPTELTKLRRLIGPKRAILIGGLQKVIGHQLLERISARQVGSWQDYIDQLKNLTAEI